jgi:ABC-type branched-subunit amino acid transport system ATPase component/ABC-type branched-subunit amino acid transport system permease subunit
VALKRRRAKVGATLIVVAFVVLLLSLSFASDYMLYVLGLVVVEAIAILSLNLLMGYAGQVSLGQAAFVGIGAFATAQFVQWKIPFPLTIIVAAIFAAGIATVVGLPALRIKGLQVAATTLAFGAVAEFLLFARPWVKNAGTGMDSARPTLIVGGKAMLIASLVGLALVLLLDRQVRHSRIGRAFYSIRDREDTAAARGVKVGQTKLLAYAFSGFYAGIAGGLFAYLLEHVSADSFTVFTSLGYVAAVVIGGLGSWSGAIVSGSLFAALPQLLTGFARWVPMFQAGLLTITPVLRPEGLGYILNRSFSIPLPTFERKKKEEIDLRTPAERIEPPGRALSLSIPVRSLLVAKDVGVRFGGLIALHDIDMEIRRGEIVGLIGPNGAGKSTFFNAVGGFNTPNSGTIHYRGKNLLELPADARAGLGIGRTFQQVGLSGPQTVWENMLFAQHQLAIKYGMTDGLLSTPRMRKVEKELESRARAALEVIGMIDYADEKVLNLSHGNQRLAEVAAAISIGPELLMLDEPFAGVGPEESEQLAQRLTELRAELDLTVLVIEHDVPLVASLCSYIYCFAEGGMLAEGSPDEVQNNPDVISIYIGEPVQKEAAGV